MALMYLCTHLCNAKMALVAVFLSNTYLDYLKYKGFIQRIPIPFLDTIYIRKKMNNHIWNSMGKEII